MAGGKFIPKGVFDMREYKKNNQVYNVRALVITTFDLEPNSKYLLGALPKGAIVQSIFKKAKDGTVTTLTPTMLKVGDINDTANGTLLKASMIAGDKADIFVENADAAVKDADGEIIITFIDTAYTSGPYAG